jgi:polar amino acid transport system substrate-binding protein
VAVGLLSAACGGTSSGSSPTGGGSSTPNPLAQYQANGINEGVTNLVPLSYEVNGQWTGEEVDIVAAIMKKLGITKINIVPVADISSLIASLQAGRTDIVDNLIIKPSRCQVINFSQPYLHTYPALAVPKGNPKGLNSLAGVKSSGASLGVIAGSQDLTAAQSAGISSVQQYPNMVAAMTAVSQGRIQAISSDEVTLAAGVQAANLSSSIDLVGPVPDFIVDGKQSGSFYDAFAFTKSSSALQNAFDQQLQAMMPSETASIGSKYGIPANGYDVTTSTASVCQG